MEQRRESRSVKPISFLPPRHAWSSLLPARRHSSESEVLSDPSDPNSPTNFFITVEGQTPALFDPNNPPAIVTTQGSVEDWTIENQALENHEFHIHQIHFLVREENGKRMASRSRTVNIWIPSTYLTGPAPAPIPLSRYEWISWVPMSAISCITATFLGHEDSGMMAIIKVMPSRGEP